MSLSADRLLAARLLIRVEGGAHASRLLVGTTPPASRVRVLEVLRWQRALDAVLEPLCRRPVQDLDAAVRVALRLGLVELARLGVPAPVATDSAVRLVKRLRVGSAAGLVNAVLRRAAMGWRARLEAAPVGVRLSHPEWLARRWADRLGAAAAESAMAADQEPALTWVWFLDPRARERLEEAGAVLQPHPWCEGAWCAPTDTPRLLEVVAAGAAYAQDPSSQLVAHLARGLTKAGARCADLCAAPGGKAALMSCGQKDVLVAGDRRLGRVRLMAPLVSSRGRSFVIAADAVRPPLAAGGWDLVLLDAPCSGTGTLRRHPEIKWRLDPERVAELASIQHRMLHSAADLVASDGLLLYSTCSVEMEENEEVVTPRPRGFAVEDLAGLLPKALPWQPTSAGGVRILPHLHGDGFTLHALRRRPPG